MVETAVKTYQVAYALLLRAAQSSLVEIVTASKKEQPLRFTVGNAPGAGARPL